MKWSVYRRAERRGVRDEEGILICKVRPKYASLIAAAPEMKLFVELAANGADLRYAEALQISARALLARIVDTELGG